MIDPSPPADSTSERPVLRRYRITHRTTYTYSEPVSSSYGRCYLLPRDTEDQRCVRSAVDISPAPADRSVGVDVYGNRDLYFQVSAAHEELIVTAESEVEVYGPEPHRLVSAPANSRWELSRPVGTDGALAQDFVLDVQPAEISDGVRDYAAVSFPPERPLLDAVLDLTSRIHRDFQYRSGSTSVSTRVTEVLEKRSGVCQDFARLAIACLRSHGLAARYVSGYLETQPPPGQERLIGVDATHAWAAVWMPGDRWLAFDPTNDQLVDERYTLVAWGRDYADVPPLRGVIYTEARNSTIAVSVDVAPLHPLAPDQPKC
ncbi:MULTISPECIES: transglutaminase N-terminal domain-containing protein [Rhodococcus]|uniref:Transglutaminase family protein n=1 Tax=Rhodococcus oxybenzonivorans TaxID=1990687 RepID=A0AAE4V1U4_9NOCA|nr:MULTISPECIES: transglutaminase family protein [Rhodococcus]MDV7242587.1 transglutaminase family protein [Rhodococcus oxybenzonivorans]MDV7266446.1 transglutaminase family protein [Rhodococcus oxybenzonivorans]MDV7276019.1 transglutaminase family protein [Rhodococcus oxybenzonivorans]MDV7332076.1 transglutaminase family protein [Rhodococcus oxybenzonivorans]MDV7344296.1 transglutaminase family protein [Rhodococcus oxybenzonivorans]